MSDFPNVHPLNPVGSISPFDLVSPTGGMLACAPGASRAVSATWGAANRAIYVPVVVPCRVTACQMAWANGAAVSGNVDAGIYDVTGVRLVSTGSTAQAGTTALQVADITDTVLTPGVYFLALAVDNTTATISRLPTNTGALQGCGVQQQDTAFTLPATATFAAPTVATLPVFAASLVANI